MISVSFLREFYKIPKSYKMQWAVIVEETKDGQKMCRLGILLVGTDKVIDVMNRKFIQKDILIPFSRKTYPATRKIFGEYVQFDTIGAVCETVRLRKSEFDVEYFTARYSPELMSTFVF